jgi:dimethylamine/trimethylamine dehydrogenase
VVDWRQTQLKRLRTVEILPGNTVTVDDVISFESKHVIIATGAHWRRDGIGRGRWRALPGHDLPGVHTPDDIMDGEIPPGRVIIYDNDHFYMGGVIAERLARNGCTVTLVTPAPLVSIWTQNTLEQERIQRRLLGLDVTIRTQTEVTAIEATDVQVTDHATGRAYALPRDHVVLVTDRLANDALARALAPALADGRVSTLRTIGDADGPGIIAQAVFAGHLAAREFTEALRGAPAGDAVGFRVERAATER